MSLAKMPALAPGEFSIGVTTSKNPSSNSYFEADAEEFGRGFASASDALRVCEEGQTRTGLNVLQHGFDDLECGRPLLHQLVNEGLPLPTKCRDCAEKDVCAPAITLTATRGARWAEWLQTETPAGSGRS